MCCADPIYRHLLRLLRTSLYEPQGKTCGQGVKLTERQWYKLLEEAEKQTLTGLLFPAISRLPDEEMPSLSLLATWLAMANRDAARYRAMSEVLSELLRLFAGSGLHPVLQKGHAASRFYSAPELRACGDIDLWFPGQERLQADDIVKSRGIRVVHTPDGGSCYAASSIEVEHHSMLIEVHNPFHSGLLGRMCALYPPVRASLPSGFSASVPSPMLELLMLNVHILKHCLGVGIGMRQICDYSMAWRSLAEPAEAGVDAALYTELCRRLGIIKWTRVLHRFINRYIPAPDGRAVAEIGGEADEAAVERIFSLVCEGGNFGKFSPGRRASRGRSMAARKLHTMSAFINNRAFVSRLAPREAFWIFSRLLLGQIH